ncbi:MAG TPA: hypothetical protein VF316_21035, partial [Polyangiaceae bacterium]
ALPGRILHGHIAQIGAEGDFATDRDVKRGRADIRTFLVRVTFDEIPDTLRTGMTATVRLTGGPVVVPPVASAPPSVAPSASSLVDASLRVKP